MCDNQLMIPVEQLVQLSQSNQATAEQLTGMMQQMGVYLLQLDARLRHQEELLQKKVTITSAQYKQLMAAMRKQAAQICGKYQLPGEAAALVRAAIKSEVLARWKVKDLHDLPESALGDALSGVGSWDSYSLVRRIRQKLEGWE